MIQQMNISFNPAQDRLLFKLNQDNKAEYRVWLTRRFTELLLKVLNEQMADSGGQQQLASSKETVNQLKSGAFDKKYENIAPPEFPLGETGILAFRINIKKHQNGVLNLQLLPEDGIGLNFNLDPSSIYMLYNLLEQALPQTQWNLQGTPVAANLLH